MTVAWPNQLACRRIHLGSEHIVLALLLSDHVESPSEVVESERQEAYQKLHANEQKLGKEKG